MTIQDFMTTLENSEQRMYFIIHLHLYVPATTLDFIYVCSVDLLEPELLLMSVSGSCCKTVIMWRAYEAESTACLFVFSYTKILVSFVFIRQAEVELGCDMFRKPFPMAYLSLANCNLSRDQGVSFRDLPP